MELELEGNVIKRIRGDDDESDVCGLWAATDRKEEVFLCRETPSMFILSTYLQGYKRNSIEIIIIKEEGGDQTPKKEEKPIHQKLVIMGEGVRKNDEKILGLGKAFKIPDGVVPDQIKAMYSEEESMLEICMPKFVKQICGVQIEEVKEEEFGESSHKVIKEFKVDIIENPTRVLEIRNKYGESDDQREEFDGKEETDEVKNSEVELNVGEEILEVFDENIVIQSLEESDNGVLGTEVDEEIIAGCRKGKETGDTEEERVEEDDRFVWRKVKEIEEPNCEIEDRDVEVKEGTDEESLQMKRSDTFVDERVVEEFENTKGGSNEIKENIGKELGFEESMETKVKDLPKEPKEPLQVEETGKTGEEDQHIDIEEPMLLGQVKDETFKERSQTKTQKHEVEAKKKVEAFDETVNHEDKSKIYNDECGDESGKQESRDSDIKLLRSSQLESPLGTQHKSNGVIGQGGSHGGHVIEVEVYEHGDEVVQRETSQELDGLRDVQVEAIEDEKANEQRDGVHVEISKEMDHELEDIKVEAREEDIKAEAQRDEVYVEIISREVEKKRKERQLNENEERKRLHGSFFVAGSAFVVSLVVFFVRHTRAQKGK